MYIFESTHFWCRNLRCFCWWMESEAKAARSRHLFLLTKKQGAFFLGNQKYATLVCQWFLPKLKESWWLDTENPQKQKKHHAKKIPSWEFNIYPFAKVGLSRWFSGFSWFGGSMFPRTLEGKTRFLSWNQRPSGSCFCQSSRGAGMLGWWSYPNLRQKWIILCLQHHLWMVLQGLEAMFFFSLLGRKLQWMVGWCVLRCLLFGYCSLAFVLFLSWILHV